MSKKKKDGMPTIYTSAAIMELSTKSQAIILRLSKLHFMEQPHFQMAIWLDAVEMQLDKQTKRRTPKLQKIALDQQANQWIE